MAKHTNVIGGIIVVSLILAAGGGAVLLLTSKAHYANVIVKNGKHHDKNFLQSLNKDFLKVWAMAAKNGQETFQIGGSTFITQGGKKKV